MNWEENVPACVDCAFVQEYHYDYVDSDGNKYINRVDYYCTRFKDPVEGGSLKCKKARKNEHICGYLGRGFESRGEQK